MYHEGVARNCALNIERSGKRIAARCSCDALWIDAACIDRPSLHGVTRIQVEDRLNSVRKVVFELGGFEGVCFRRSRAFWRLAIGFPFQIDLVLNGGSRAGDAITVDRSYELDRFFGARLDYPLNTIPLKRSLERIVAKFACQHRPIQV